MTGRIYGPLKTLFLFAYLFCIGVAFDYFRNYQVLLACLLLGIVLFALTAFYTDKERNSGNEFTDTAPDYAGQNVFIFFAKLAAIAGLAYLWLYYMARERLLLSSVALVFAYLQLFLLFKTNKRQVQASASGDIPQPEAGQIKKSALIVRSALIVISAFLLVFSYFSFTTYKIHEGISLLLVSALILAYVRGKKNRFEPAGADTVRYGLSDLALCLIAAAAALFMRFFMFLDVPPGINGDEINAVIMLHSGMLQGMEFPIYIASEMSSATLCFHLILFLSKFFKPDMSLFYGVSGAIGAINVIFTYLLAKEMFNKRIIAFASALILAFMVQHIIFSRLVATVIFTPAIAAICFYLYFAGMRRGNVILLALSGLFMGLGVYFYTPARVVPFIFAAYWIMGLLRREGRADFKKTAATVFLMAAAAVIVFLPLLDFIIKRPDVFFARMSVTSQIGTYAQLDFVKLFINQFEVYYNMFFIESALRGISSLVSQPAFDPVTVVLFVAGLGACMTTMKKRVVQFLVLWLFFALLVIGMLSQPADLFPVRVVLMLPAVAIIAAYGLYNILSAVEALNSRFISAFFRIMALLIMIAMAAYNFNKYFVEYPKDPAVRYFHGYKYKLMRDVIRDNMDAALYFSAYYKTEQTEKQVPNILIYLDEKGEYVDFSLFELSRLYRDKKEDVFLVGESVFGDTFGIYKEYFPNAAIEKVYNPDMWIYTKEDKNTEHYGWRDPAKVISVMRRVIKDYDWYNPHIHFVTCRIPYGDIEALYGLKMICRGRDNGIGETIFRNSGGECGTDGGEIILSGMIEVPEYGRYALKVSGAGSAVIQLEGKKHGGAELLAKGLHRIKITGKAATAGGVSILWSKNGGAFELVPVSHLINSQKKFGLSADYYDAEKVVYKAVESVVNHNNYFFDMRPGVKKCTDKKCEVVLTGKIRTENPGVYYIYLETAWQSSVKVNGIAVSEKKEYGKPENTPIYLGKGMHNIKIQTQARILQNSAILMMKREGMKDYFPVKYELLTP